MSEPDPGTSLVLAHTGEVVNLEDERQIALAYREVDDLEFKLKEAKRRLREAWGERARVLGRKTIYVDGVGKVEVRSQQRTTFPDPMALEEELRRLGCPEEIIREIVVEEVSYKVDGVRARQAAGANPEYAKAIEDAKQVTDQIPTVTVTKEA